MRERIKIGGEGEEVIEKISIGDKKNFINTAASRFLDKFKYTFPCKITPGRKFHRWIVDDKRITQLKNIFILTLEDSIENEQLRIINENEELKIINELSQKKIEEFEKRLSEIKQDIDYISKMAEEKAAEEEKYG